MLSKKVSLAIYAILGLVFLFGIFFFTRKLVTYQKELTIFEKHKINGIITELKNTQRGTYDIEISSGDEIPNLRLGWELEKYNIQIGDSVSKKENSKIMTFYKFKDGIAEKCFDYEIGL